MAQCYHFIHLLVDLLVESAQYSRRNNENQQDCPSFTQQIKEPNCRDKLEDRRY